MSDHVPGESDFESIVRFGGLLDASFASTGQVGPTCGFEAIEALINIHRPDVEAQYGSRLSDELLIPMAREAGHAGDGTHPSLATSGYAHLLSRFALEAWSLPWLADGSFPHSMLTGLLNWNRVALVVVKPDLIDAELYAGAGPDARHAVLVTNYVVAEAGWTIDALVGLDSNRPGQQMMWPFAMFDAAVRAPVERRAHWAAVWVRNEPPRPTTPFFLRAPDGTVRPSA